MEKFYFEAPSISREEDAISFIKEFYEYNSPINGVGSLHKYLDDYEGWLEKITDDFTRNPSKDLVPAHTYFLIRDNDDKIIGMINIRIGLTEKLKRHGRHIGYSIRPTERGKGYNKINLYIGLKICNYFHLSKVQLDAKESNIASWKTIESLGGKCIGSFIDNGEKFKKYEIDVQESIKNNREKYEKLILTDAIFK